MNEMPNYEPSAGEPREKANNVRYTMAGGLVLALVIVAIVVANSLGGQASPAIATPAPAATPAVATATPTPLPTHTATTTVVPTSNPAPSRFASKFSFQPLAIMVDNHIDARPQSGLNNADVVYEAVTEAGITRFMAIYANQEAEVVGPVRSCRHYFVYWASEYDAIYAHIGASPQGYDALRATGITSLDAARGRGVYWRSNDRLAPHNAYASTKELRDSTTDEGEGRLGALRFGQYDTIAKEGGVTEVKIVHPDDYSVAYTYSEKKNVYLRYMEGYPHVDAWSGLQYEPKNVIVQFVETWRINGDREGRVDMALVGRGKAYVFTGGKAIEGAWIKEGLARPTRFVDAQGDDIVLNPGQTWIQVVPDGGTVSYK